MASSLRAETELDRRFVATHTVVVAETADYARVLMVDGRRLLEDGLILLDEPTEVAGVPVLTGLAGAGGNACNAAPFVLVLSPDGATRLDGPLDTCALVEVTPEGPDRLRLASGALPTTPGEAWTWTPQAGFTGPQAVAFAPDPARGGYEDLSWLALSHPVDALSIVAVHDELRGGLGADWLRYAAVLEGIGAGDLVAGGYRGEACRPEVCEQEFAILWLDAAMGRAFAWWIEAGQAEGQGYPRDMKDWSAWVLDDLAERRGG